MDTLPKISDAEWDVMEIIWSHSPISGNQVAKKLSTKHDWHLRTIKTMLGRLTRKGVLTFTKEKNTYWYSAAIARENYIQQVSRNFIQRLFNGSNSLALTHFVESAELSREEITRLNELLEKKRVQ